MAQTLEAASDRQALEEQPPSRASLLSLWPLAGYAALASVIALVSKSLLFPLYSGNSDESVYIYQGRMFTQGHLTLSAHTHAEFFRPWLFGQRGSRLFPQYQPSWPSVIAVAHFLGNERIALVIAAVAVTVAIWFLAQEFAPGSAIFAVGLFLVSPIFIVHSATFLPYIWMTALATGGTAAALAGLRTGRRWPYVVSGVLFGIAQLTRPFDALIFAVPTAWYLALKLFVDPPRLRKAAGWIGIGLAPFLIVTVLYNTHLTGAPLRFPFQAAEALDTFGFGYRKLVPDMPPYKYTVQKAIRGLQENGGAMPRWLAGGGIGVVLALITVAMRRRRADTWLIFSLALLFPAVYFFWWGTSLSGAGARNGLGPHYYVPAFAPLAVLAGWSLQSLAQRSWRLAAVVIVAIVAGTLLVLPGIRDNARFTEGLSRTKLHAVTTPKLTNAVVVMRADPILYTLLNYQFLVGDPALTDDVLYAIDRGARTSDLSALLPSRKLYQWVQRVEPGNPPGVESNFLEPLSIKTGTTVTLKFDITSTDARRFTLGYVSLDGKVVSKQVLDSASRRGKTHRLEVVLGANGASLPKSRPGLLAVRIPRDGVAQVGAGFGPDDDLGHADLFELRYFVGKDAEQPYSIAVQTPGLHFHVVREPFEDSLRENVGPHLVEVR